MSQDESSPEPSDISEPASEDRPLSRAWQPLTFRGAAAFSRATLGRLLLVQVIVASLITGSFLWFLSVAWFPTIREGIRQLPETGVIQNQRLSSPRNSTAPLAESRFLALVMDVDGTGTPSVSSDFKVEFRRQHFAWCAYLGCRVFNYPAGQTVQFNQPELESWWAAWEPMIYAWIGLGLMTWFMVSWFILATLYCPVLRIYAFFKDRRVTLAGSWKAAAACLLPGALLMGVSILLYGMGVIDLARLLILWVLHFILGWVFLFLTPLRLPRTSDALPSAQTNPFGSERTPPLNPFNDLPTPPPK